MLCHACCTMHVCRHACCVASGSPHVFCGLCRMPVVFCSHLMRLHLNVHQVKERWACDPRSIMQGHTLSVCSSKLLKCNALPGAAGAAERHVWVQHGAAQYDPGQGRVHHGVLSACACHGRPASRAVWRIQAHAEQQGVSALYGWVRRRRRAVAAAVWLCQQLLIL